MYKKNSIGQSAANDLRIMLYIRTKYNLWPQFNDYPEREYTQVSGKGKHLYTFTLTKC